MSATEIEFVDELPKATRNVTSGVWVERLAPLRERPDQWAKVFGPTNSPHAIVSNLKNGGAAGIVPDDFEFAGRNLPTGNMVTEAVTDEDGNETGETREVPEVEGYVYARFLSEQGKAERDQREAERAAKRAEKEQSEGKSKRKSKKDES